MSDSWIRPATELFCAVWPTVPPPGQAVTPKACRLVVEMRRTSAHSADHKAVSKVARRPRRPGQTTSPNGTKAPATTESAGMEIRGDGFMSRG